MPDDRIIPEAFNERFTIRADSDGASLLRSLSEMTAGEVLSAVKWQSSLAKRLVAETKPWLRIVEAVANDDDAKAERLTRHLSEAELTAGFAKLRECADAQATTTRLLSLIRAVMPNWDGQGMTFGAAVRLYWHPPGRVPH